MMVAEAELLAAHAAGDLPRLVSFYAEAAEALTDEDEAAFFLTHAYVFALQSDHPDLPRLRDRLIAMGREEAPLPPRARLP